MQQANYQGAERYIENNVYRLPPRPTRFDLGVTMLRLACQIFFLTSLGASSQATLQ